MSDRAHHPVAAMLALLATVAALVAVWTAAVVFVAVKVLRGMEVIP